MIFIFIELVREGEESKRMLFLFLGLVVWCELVMVGRGSSGFEFIG